MLERFVVDSLMDLKSSSFASNSLSLVNKEKYVGEKNPNFGVSFSSPSYNVLIFLSVKLSLKLFSVFY